MKISFCHASHSNPIVIKIILFYLNDSTTKHSPNITDVEFENETNCVAVVHLHINQSPIKNG